MITKRRALFLDRDGTINVDYGYVYKQKDFHFIDGIFDLVNESTRLGYLNIIITNQSGIGRKYFSEKDFHSLMIWVCNQFIEYEGRIDEVYFCPNHPEYGLGSYKCESIMRKPAPGMIFKAKEDYDIDLSSSLLIGDSFRDIEAGKSAGVGRNLLFDSSRLRNSSPFIDTQTVQSLLDVIPML